MSIQSATQQIEVAHNRLAQQLRSLVVLCVGMAVTFCVYGYQFGRGNHAVYLLDALRQVNPTLLANDWFTTHTLQYHFVFTRLASLLMRAGFIEQGFLAIYIALVLVFHIAWRGIVRHLGGGDGAYLLSVALYYFSAAGTALGMYQFFQDSSLLPSNIANVALLCGIWLWLSGRIGWAGICFGIAGAFHLNHALVGSALWLTLVLLPIVSSRLSVGTHSHRGDAETQRAHDLREASPRLRVPAVLMGTLAAILPSAVNIAVAARSKLSLSGAMPLSDFVNLYVRLRHPHHYDPSSWPLGIWVAVMWTFIPAVALLRGAVYRVYLFFLALVVVALLGAGCWYVSETLVQMSLYRFSIYLQLLGCAAAGVLIERSLRRPITGVAFGIGTCGMIIVLCIVRGPFFGLFRMPRDDPDYLKLCEWVSKNTPADAIFLVPPDEESMRLIGRRAIVVNFKSVPQLSAELSQWQTRLSDVLDMRSLNELPHDYRGALSDVHTRYGRVSSHMLQDVAGKYGARYIVATHALDGLEERRINIDAIWPYVLYDLAR